MSIKDLLLPLGLALLTVWGINYFWGPRSTSAGDQAQVVSGQIFVAPKERQEFAPLNKEIDFIDVRRPGEPTITEIETKGALYQFSTEGATLERLEFRRQRGDVLTTIFPLGEHERERRCFLIAFQEKSPFFYTLQAHNTTALRHELIYQAETDQAFVQKKYTLYDATYKIDLEVTVKPKNTAITTRIFYPAPVVPDIAKYDVISGIYNNQKGSVEKTARASLNLQQGWFSPTLFGIEDRYFTHAMVADPNNFARRAYYTTAEQTGLTAILEAAPVTVDTTWKVSFYCGPKEQESFAVVDPRLEQTLDYAGIFLGPISRVLLYILKLLYSLVNNYGIAIILLTLLIKLLLLPFTFKSDEGMKKRLEFDKKLKYLQQKYKDDPDMLARERAELVKKHGMPGLASCLPLLLQLPIFIALSRVLSGSIELYRAPFGGWIKDLSMPDQYYVLPVLLALSMILQALTADKSQRWSLLAMALIFGAITANMAAGLTLYILMNALLSVLQTYLINKARSLWR
jgi:YidC/Oxa1 family membrane protein insertase